MKRSMLLTLLLIAGCAQPARYLMGDKDQFRSGNLLITPRVIIYLPEDYDRSRERYPVLYAHDGQNLFTNATSFAGEWMLDENIEALQAAGLLDGIIVVGIYNTPNRITDYTPTFISNEDVNNEGGGLTNYARFIVENLKPYIDANFRTLPDREHTGVMGSSLGGLASFYLLGMYPEVFSRAGVISPSFWWDNVRVTNDMRSFDFPPDVKIYIDGGWIEEADESSMVDYMRLVYERLVAMGLKDIDNIYYYEDPMGHHNEADWARRGKMPLLYLFGKFDQTVTGGRLSVAPPLIGVGDVSKVFATVRFTNAMLYTRFMGDFSVNNGNASIDRYGELRGLKSGETVVSLSVAGMTLTQAVTITAHTRELAELTFSVHTQVPMTGLTLRIVKESGHATNVNVPLRQVSPTNAQAVLIRKTGTSVVYQVFDSAGRAAHNPAGAEIRVTTQFNRDKVIDITAADFR